MTVQHRPGKLHVDADALSRLRFPNPCIKTRAEVGDLLRNNLFCGACHYCTRAHSHWLGFQEQVDDVIPLANATSSSKCKEDRIKQALERNRLGHSSIDIVNTPIGLSVYATPMSDLGARVVAKGLEAAANHQRN